MGLREQLLKGATAVAMPVIVDVVEDMLSPENIAKAGDQVLDVVEDWIARTDTKWDDTLCLPLINALRERLNIPDNDTPAR